MIKKRIDEDINKDSIKALIGVDYPLYKKIDNALLLYEATRTERIVISQRLRNILRDYEGAVDNTWAVMRDTGVVAICTECAISDGGSCCGRGIEDRFDVSLILINLLISGDIPRERTDKEGCFFLGERGCLIRARHTICVNYICKRIETGLTAEELYCVQDAIFQETEKGFLLEETLKREIILPLSLQSP